jgi:hypothetical protein
VPNKFKSPENIPYLNIHEQCLGYINTTTKEFYLSDSYERKASSEESEKQQNMLLSFIKSEETAFDPSHWKAFGIYFLMSEDEYTLYFKESVTADLSAWAGEIKKRLNRLYTGAFDQITAPQNLAFVAVASKTYEFGNVFNYFANKVGNEKNSSQENINSTTAPQQISEKKFK